jgi:hypothetical protein
MKRFFPLISLVVLAGCSLLNSPPADAATSIVDFVHPTTNNDNSPIVDNGTDETSLASWRVEFGTCSAPNVFGVKAGEVIRTRPVGGASLTSVTLNTQSGLKCFRVFVTNLAGRESDASNVASRTIEAPTPRSPTGVTVRPQ